MRLHQSWYRARVLRVPYGTGPKQSSKAFYGNMLPPEAGERGLNFLTPHIFNVAKRRLAEKKGVIDRFRFLCDLMSVQALYFNLLGPLVDQRELAADFFRLLYPGEVKQLRRIRLAYIPEPAVDLNDPAGFDAFTEYERPDGKLAFIGIRMPGMEDLKARASIQPVFWMWTKREGSPWPEAVWPGLVDPQVNLLWRGHLLQQAMMHRPGSPYAAGQFLFLYHPLDEKSISSAQTYQRLLKPEGHSFSALALDMLVSRWREAATRKLVEEWLEEFVKRYLDFAASDSEMTDAT
jgi:hypothetical protein